MKILAIIGMISALLASGCKRQMNAGLAGKKRDAFEVRATPEKIIFRGLDDPEVTDERPDDVYVESVKAGRYNGTVMQRCRDEAKRAMVRLRPVVISADTNVLIRSLRSGYDNDVDRWVSLYGNLAIGEELVKREPIPDRLHPPPNEWGYFTGDSGPPAFTLEDFLKYIRHQFPALNAAE
jgi:hypothetical protein